VNFCTVTAAGSSIFLLNECGPVKSHKFGNNVMPAKAGIQEYHLVIIALDPGFRRGDDFFTRAAMNREV
jgi:hypothetical protein